MSGPLITEPGFFLEVTPTQYFAEPCPEPALTNSGMDLLDPPARFASNHPMMGGNVDDLSETIASRMGNVVHRLALGKGRDYAISPFDDYRTGEAKAWKKAQEAAGIVPIKQDAFNDAQVMADKMKARIDELCQGHEYFTEVVIAWQETMSLRTVWCRAMLDVWCPALLLGIDLKTCLSAREEDVKRQFANGYARQDVWYSRGISKLTGGAGRVKFGFMFCEKSEPFLMRNVKPSESFRHGAEHDVKKALAIFSECMANNEWPGFEDLTVTPPNWLLSRWTSGEMMELANGN